MNPTNPTPSNTRYTPLTQQEYCCVPTCIQMVMLRNHIPLVPVELIGYHMGLIVPEDTAHLFYHPRTGDRPPAGYGTQIGKPEYEPNTMFKTLNIPLQMSWSLIDKFTTLADFKQYLQQHQDTDYDILVCFDWPSLFDPSGQDHWGHVCVLDTIDVDNNQLRLIDPSPRSPKWVTVDIDQLYQSMCTHTKDNSGGFWELHRDVSGTSISFAADLVPLVLNGSKTLTYRRGTKYTHLQVGDIVSVSNSATDQDVAKVQITETGYTTFESLPIDRPGHEPYNSKQHQRQVFQQYYPEISDQDPIFIIGFKLIS